MRLGQLTLPFTWNYGGILQGYALNKVLNDLGHDAIIISRRRNRPNPIVRSLVRFKWAMSRTLSYVPIFRVLPLICVETFKRKYLKKATENIFSDNQLKSLVSIYNFEGYVVGSDQIWNFNAASHITNAYFDFDPDINKVKISYAASFAASSWNYPEYETEKCKELIKQFDGISVREYSGVILSKEHLHVEAEHHIDPTMLLQKDDYIKIINNSKTAPSNGKLLLYILDDTEERRKVAKYVEEFTNLKPFGVRQFEKTKIIKDALKGIYPSVEQWLKCFNDAEFVVTDSFHGTVFSIIFNKPFICLGNSERGLARFESLLTQFGLMDRLVVDSKDLEKIDIKAEIDWDRVNSILEFEKEKAFNYLNKNLK